MLVFFMGVNCFFLIIAMPLVLLVKLVVMWQLIKQGDDKLLAALKR